MERSQSRRGLRRSHATTNLRGNDHDTTQSAPDLLDWDTMRPVEVRQMSSSTTNMMSPQLHHLPRSVASSDLTMSKRRSRMPYAAHDAVPDLDGTAYTCRRHRHKDSAVTLEDDRERERDQNRPALSSSTFSIQKASPRLLPASSPSTITTVPYSTHDNNTTPNDTASSSSTIRFSVSLPYMHPPDCCCTTCRQIRHQRRKTSLKLNERLEACRQIALKVQDPRDPHNAERGLARGHWLRLARLYVKYETLVDVMVMSTAEEDELLTQFIRAFSAVVHLMEVERSKWWRLFLGDGNKQLHTAVVSHKVQPRIVDICHHPRGFEHDQDCCAAAEIDSTAWKLLHPGY